VGVHYRLLQTAPLSYKSAILTAAFDVCLMLTVFHACTLAAV
jgi:hypothetical protein